MATPRYIRASQVPASTRYIRASQAPASARYATARQAQAPPSATRLPTSPGFPLGQLGAGLGSLGSLARLAPDATGLGAGLGLAGNLASLANLFRSGNTASTPRKILGGASAVTGGVSNANQLAGAMGAGNFLSPGVASGLGTAGGLLGIGSGALGLAEGGGPESGAQIISGAMALAGMGGPAAIFALAPLLASFHQRNIGKRDIKNAPRRAAEGAAEVASLLGPTGAPDLASFLAHPQLAQAANIADWMNRGGAFDLRLGPIPEAYQLVEQLRGVQNAGYSIPKWDGPQNLEALSFVGGAPHAFTGLSTRLAELGYPFQGEPFTTPTEVETPGSPLPDGGFVDVQRAWQDPRSGGAWAPNPLRPLDLGTVTRAQLDQYRPAYAEQMAAGGTTAASFEDWAARQLSRDWGLYSDAGTPPVKYQIAG